jgi:hypothetical protein
LEVRRTSIRSVGIVNTATGKPLRHAPTLDLRPGEMVRVRSASEIFSTLDASGTLDGVPFMPEMVKYCGRTLPVTRRADTTCAGAGVVRRMRNTVHLEKIRCDGSAHDGCQAACLLFWKEAWLERVENGEPPAMPGEAEEAFVAERLVPGTRTASETNDGKTLYRCQATEIPKATEPLRFLQIGQYVRGLRSWRLRKFLRGLPIEVFNIWQAFSRRRLPARLRIADGNKYPFVVGTLKKGQTPSDKLDLRPGDYVRIKSKEEIVATLDDTNHNRGLFFDGEMASYCGRTARVQGRVNRLIEESTGEMIEIKSDCIILEGVVCAADYYRFCTRAIYSYWREIWLEKIDAPEDNQVSAPCVATRWSRV